MIVLVCVDGLRSWWSGRISLWAFRFHLLPLLFLNLAPLATLDTSPITEFFAPKITYACFEKFEEILDCKLLWKWIHHLFSIQRTFCIAWQLVNNFSRILSRQKLVKYFREEIIDKLVEVSYEIREYQREVAHIVIEDKLGRYSFWRHVYNAASRDGCWRAAVQVVGLYDDSHLLGERKGFSGDKRKSSIVIQNRVKILDPLHRDFTVEGNPALLVPFELYSLSHHVRENSVPKFSSFRVYLPHKLCHRLRFGVYDVLHYTFLRARLAHHWYLSRRQAWCAHSAILLLLHVLQSIHTLPDWVSFAITR